MCVCVLVSYLGWVFAIDIDIRTKVSIILGGGKRRRAMWEVYEFLVLSYLLLLSFN